MPICGSRHQGPFQGAAPTLTVALKPARIEDTGVKWVSGLQVNVFQRLRVGFSALKRHREQGTSLDMYMCLRLFNFLKSVCRTSGDFRFKGAEQTREASGPVALWVRRCNLEVAPLCRRTLWWFESTLVRCVLSCHVQEFDEPHQC